MTERKIALIVWGVVACTGFVTVGLLAAYFDKWWILFFLLIVSPRMSDSNDKGESP